MEPHGQVFVSLAQSTATDMATFLIHFFSVLISWCW